MRNLLLLLIIILTFCLSFYACGDKEEFNYVPTQYYPVYKQGDTLIYKSGNKYDTFRYTSASIYNYKYDEKYNYQEITYDIMNKNYPEYNTPCKITLMWDKTGVDWLSFNNEFNYTMQPTIPSIFINNFTYYNIFELMSQDPPMIHSNVIKVYFNYKYWVVRFIKTDSTTWDLVQH